MGTFLFLNINDKCLKAGVVSIGVLHLSVQYNNFIKVFLDLYEVNRSLLLEASLISYPPTQVSSPVAN